VERLTEQIRDRHGLGIHVEDDHLPKVMDEHVRVLLFQAVRELLVNIIKHARAGGAVVAIRREGDWIRVAVSDDGVGFDPAAARAITGKGGGFGLFNIQERLASIGGSLEFENPGARGTRIVLRAPLPRRQTQRRGR
jgi:signal transduction histidine kinase